MNNIALRFFSNLASWFRVTFAEAPDKGHSIDWDSVINTDDGINCILVHAFAHGSALAFRSIYDHYAPGIYRVSLRFLQSNKLAEELVSEVFSTLWFKRTKFSEPDEVRLFLFTYSRTVALSYLKRIVENEETGNSFVPDLESSLD